MRVIRRRSNWGLIGLAAVMYVAVAGRVSLHAAQDAVTPETNLDNALPKNATGEDIFRMACSTCHAIDGTGSPSSVVGFALPLPDGHLFPDFNDCPTNTVEPKADWVAVVTRGGPMRCRDPKHPLLHSDTPAPWGPGLPPPGRCAGCAACRA